MTGDWLGVPAEVAATTIRCGVPGCSWKTTSYVRAEAAAAGVWHTYEEHRPEWIAAIGDRPPRDPRPETFLDPERN